MEDREDEPMVLEGETGDSELVLRLCLFCACVCISLTSCCSNNQSAIVLISLVIAEGGIELFKLNKSVPVVFECVECVESINDKSEMMVEASFRLFVGEEEEHVDAFSATSASRKLVEKKLDEAVDSAGDRRVA